MKWQGPLAIHIIVLQQFSNPYQLSISIWVLDADNNNYVICAVARANHVSNFIILNAAYNNNIIVINFVPETPDACS